MYMYMCVYIYIHMIVFEQKKTAAGPAGQPRLGELGRRREDLRHAGGEIASEILSESQKRNSVGNRQRNSVARGEICRKSPEKSIFSHQRSQFAVRICDFVGGEICRKSEGKILHTRDHTSEILSEIATDNPLENATE